MIKKKDIERLIDIFAEKTGCNIQHNGSPCNTCFHSIDDADFTHITWLMLLWLRGDYTADEIFKSIKDELKMEE